MENIKLIFGGDIFCDDSHVEVRKKILAIIRKHDVRCCNLEGSIPDLETKKISQKIGPKLEQKISVIKLIKKLGFNYINLSNNHVLDNGYDSMINTIKQLGRIKTLGFGNRTEAYKLTIVKKRKMVIGLLSFSEWSFSTITAKNHIGSSWINDVDVDAIIAESKRKVDILLVIVHAGAEYLEVPLPEWREKYRNFIRLGADYVIGHHPHVVQGYEKYKKGYIFYSLGNLYFSGSKNGSGVLLSLDISEKKQIHKLIGLSNSGNVLILNKEYDQKIKQLNKMLKGKKYNRLVWEYCKKNWKEHIKKYIEFFVDSVFVKNIFLVVIKKILNIFNKKKVLQIKNLYLIHSIMNETNRYIIYRALFLKRKNEKR